MMRLWARVTDFCDYAFMFILMKLASIILAKVKYSKNVR